MERAGRGDLAVRPGQAAVDSLVARGKSIISLRDSDKGLENRQSSRETPNYGGGCSQGAIFGIFTL